MLLKRMEQILISMGGGGTTRIKCFGSLAEAQNYAGAKGELTAVYPKGLSLIRTLFLHNGTVGGGVPISKMIMTGGSIIYINASTGDDTMREGRGWDANKPFKTIRAALYYAHMFVDIQGAGLTFHLAPGEYTMPDNGWNVPWCSKVVFDGKNNTNAGEVIVDTSGTNGDGWVINGGFVDFRNIHMKGHGYAVLRCCYNNCTVLTGCTIEMTASDSNSHTLLYAYDNGYILINTPITFTSSSATGDLYILHATRNGGIQISNVNGGAITFNVPNSNKSHFLVATKAGSIVTPTETNFTVSGETSDIQAIQVYEGARISGHGTVYNSQPTTQPTVAAVLRNDAKTVALMDTNAVTGNSVKAVYEPDISYMERQRFFAELDEEYRRVGILE